MKKLRGAAIPVPGLSSSESFRGERRRGGVGVSARVRACPNNMLGGLIIFKRVLLREI